MTQNWQEEYLSTKSTKNSAELGEAQAMMCSQTLGMTMSISWQMYSSTLTTFLKAWALSRMMRLAAMARSFLVGYAREGQITICKDMLDQRRIDNSKDNFYFFLDGIFDCEEIYKLILEKQGKLPIIAYNKRGSSCESIEELPEDDWRFLYNPLLHFPSHIFMIYKQRDASERFNSHSKAYTSISRIANKVKKQHTILKSNVEHIATFTFIMEQLKLLTEYKDKLRQTTLRNFL